MFQNYILLLSLFGFLQVSKKNKKNKDQLDFSSSVRGSEGFRLQRFLLSDSAELLLKFEKGHELGDKHHVW